MPLPWPHRQGCFLVLLGIRRCYHGRKARNSLAAKQYFVDKAIQEAEFILDEDRQAVAGVN